MRLFAIYKLGLVTGDSLVYADIAKNLLQHGVFGQTDPNGGVTPTLIRLPGYVFFVAAIFRIFGQDHFRAIMLVQAAMDVGTCFLVADIARRTVSNRAARIAFLLAALCPFTANYTATPLTEIPSIFFITLAVQQAVIAFDELRYRYWIYCGLAISAAILMRPDGGLILGAIGMVLLLRIYRIQGERKRLFVGGLVMTAVALAPLVPWTIRNWRTLHVFQPLVTYHATDPGEFVPEGWERWLRTWLLDYSNVEDVAFHVDEEPLKIRDVPSRAFTSPQERQYVAQLFDEYNQTNFMTPAIDQKFGDLAQQNIRKHPVRYYVGFPLVRLFSMWFRPRTELLPFDTHWWTFYIDRWNTVGASLLALFNLLLIAVAVAGILRGEPVRYMLLLLLYPIVRSLFLLMTGTAEDRYTLECFPFLFVLGARWLASLRIESQLWPVQERKKTD